jgi:hypothetical protein
MKPKNESRVDQLEEPQTIAEALVDAFDGTELGRLD